MRSSHARAAFFATLLLFPSACAPTWKNAPHDRFFQRVPPVPPHQKPMDSGGSKWWSSLVQSTLRPLGEEASPGHWLDRLDGGVDALDVNAFGQVIDSTWYENRITRGVMDRRSVARGPNQLVGPSPGDLLVLGGKVEGATPGLIVRDSEGHDFVLKFDPPAFPEMASAAETISTKILYAAGYNVPENYVVRFDLARLRLAPGATTGGAYGEKVPLDEDGLAAIVSHVNPYKDGKIRALFSRMIPGEGIGPFGYRGVRADDPNDRLPHEHRRSLRGLKVFQSWINNADVSDENTFDTFFELQKDGEVPLGIVVHYLLDFGGALGSDGTKPKSLWQGYEGLLDWPAFGAAFFSLGLYYPRWLAVQRSPYRAVGNLESEVFTPSRWHPAIPNPAFDAMNALDEYWAASVLARFTPDLLAAIVATGEYSEPGAAEWVLRVLSERQYRWMAQGFRRVLPLDLPSIEGAHLELFDLEVATGLLTDLARVRYRWTARWNKHRGADLELDRGEAEAPIVDLDAAFARARKTAKFFDDPFVTVRFERPREDGSPGPGFELHLRLLQNGTALVVGLAREVN